MKKYDIFLRVFDIANQQLTSHSPPNHSVNPRSFFGRFSDYGCYNTEGSVSLTDNDVRTLLEGVENQNTKKKTESYVFSGFDGGFFQLENLLLVDIGRVPDRFPLSLRTNSKTENFVC